MKSLRSSALTLAATLLLAVPAALAADRPAAAKEAVSAQAKADYPLATCVVSGDKLVGDMGGPIDYVYKVKGQPDRLVRFCCKDCIKDFEKDPAKYVAKIDEAAAAKAKGAATSKP